MNEEIKVSLEQRIDDLEKSIDDTDNWVIKVKKELREEIKVLHAERSEIMKRIYQVTTQTREAKTLASDIDTTTSQLFLFLKGVFMGLGYESVGKEIDKILQNIRREA